MWTLQLSPECSAQPSAALFSPRGGRRDTVTHPLQFQLVTLFRLAVILKVQFTQFKKSYCLTQWYPATQRALGSFQSKFGDFLQLPMYNGGECSFFVCTALKSDNEERFSSVTMSLMREHCLRWGFTDKSLAIGYSVSTRWRPRVHEQMLVLWDLIIGIKKHPWMTI